MKIFQKFNPNAALWTFIGTKVTRYSEAFLDTVGEENILAAIKNGEWLTDKIPEEKKIELKMMAMQYAKIISELDPNIVYTWLPDKYITIFEATPNGKAWAIGQLQIIQNYICS